MQGIIERRQVRINLFLEVSRQEPETLTCLHGRAGQHNPLDIPAFQG